jgi:hypothetical protein
MVGNDTIAITTQVKWVRPRLHLPSSCMFSDPDIWQRPEIIYTLVDVTECGLDVDVEFLTEPLHGSCQDDNALKRKSEYSHQLVIARY